MEAIHPALRAQKLPGATRMRRSAYEPTYHGPPMVYENHPFDMPRQDHLGFSSEASYSSDWLPRDGKYVQGSPYSQGSGFFGNEFSGFNSLRGYGYAGPGRGFAVEYSQRYEPGRGA